MINKYLKNVCIFASSSNYLEKCFYEDAGKLGRLIAENGLNIVYGGSSLGLMWACAEEVKLNGGKLTGVIPEKLHDFGVWTNKCDEIYVTKEMRSRKIKMDELSQAVIALPGGFGTIEELTEMIVQKQLGYNNKPVVLLNTNGFYNKLADFFNEIIRKNFANAKVSNLYYIAETPADAINYILNYDYSVRSLSEDDIYNQKV